MVELDKKHRKVLCYIYRHPFTQFSKIEKRFKKLHVDVICDNLIKKDLILCTVAKSLEEDLRNENQHCNYYNSNYNAFSKFQGNIIVEGYYSRLLTFILPLLISAVALILSFISVAR